MEAENWSHLVIKSLEDNLLEECKVTWSKSATAAHIMINTPSGYSAETRSDVDFEEALVELRSLLEAEGKVLACNRFRRNAFVSPMSRQMSDGLGCYLVRFGQPVDPEKIVRSLDSADPSKLATAAANEAFLRRWKLSSWLGLPMAIIRDTIRRRHPPT